jgi:hypothetical protein
MPRYFTLTQVREALPRVKRLIAQAVDAKEKYQETERWSQDFVRRVMVMGGMVVDRKPFLLNHDMQTRCGERLKAAVEAIQETGAVIKDLDMGLVDFPTMFHGNEVYICWRLGEDDVEYWHGIDEGFAGRKAIDRDFVDNHSASDVD